MPTAKPTPFASNVITPDLLRSLPLPDYRQDADKADRGKLLIVAGSRRLPGAALLAARAALRAGCGTVRVAAPESVALAIGVALPELMVIPLPETSDGTISLDAINTLEAQYEPCDAMIIGPGLDTNEQTDEVARRLYAGAPLPLLVDAQGLLAIASTGGNVIPKGQRVLTPHAAELRTLSGLDRMPEEGKEEAARENLAHSFSRERRAILVYKGRETLIASPNGDLYRNTAGTRGLGTAGSGDTLAGIVGSFLAQGLEPSHAAVWGVYLHALAGESVAEELGEDGLVASDWVDRLPRVLRTLRLRAG